MRKALRIFTFMSSCIFALVINSKAQSILSIKQEPQTNKKNSPALKIDTGSFSNDFVMKPRYSERLGAPAPIPNGYRPSDDTIFNMPVAKILPTITIKKVTKAP